VDNDDEDDDDDDDASRLNRPSKTAVSFEI
jgi:hypothetical protein